MFNDHYLHSASFLMLYCLDSVSIEQGEEKQEIKDLAKAYKASNEKSITLSNCELTLKDKPHTMKYNMLSFKSTYKANFLWQV